MSEVQQQQQKKVSPGMFDRIYKAINTPQMYFAMTVNFAILAVVADRTSIHAISNWLMAVYWGYCFASSLMKEIRALRPTAPDVASDKDTTDNP